MNLSNIEQELIPVKNIKTTKVWYAQFGDLENLFPAILVEIDGDYATILKFSLGLWVERWVLLSHLFVRTRNISDLIYESRKGIIE